MKRKYYFDYYYCHLNLNNWKILKLNQSQSAIDYCLDQQSGIIVKGASHE
ncbi:hypothetical protein Q5O24_06495 [Eubacteriaceae bacterium ES3]|nr:hypothetical protein Q5O24_06495 [Eubacteriaceae bacterium ES3]